MSFKYNKTCAGVVNVLRVDDCRNREMAVNFIGDNKSQRKVRPCLDDLFGSFNVNEIAFVDQDWRIGFRRFGTHLQSFFRELIEVARNFCSELNLHIKYFGISSLHKDKLDEIYNQTQIECFKTFFHSNNFSDKSSYQFTDEHNMENQLESSIKCDEVMQEQVENVITIDLFGFTEPSVRVMECIKNQNRDGKFIEQVIIIPAIMRFIDIDYDFSLQDDFIESSKHIMNITLCCLQSF